MNQTNNSILHFLLAPNDKFDNDVFGYMKDPIQKQLATDVFSLIDAYRRVEFGHMHGGLLENVHVLYGQTQYEDCMQAYPDRCMELLKVLASPAVSKAAQKVKSVDMEGILDMLHRFYDFLMFTKTPEFITLLQQYNLWCFPDEYSREDLLKMRGEYMERIKAAETGKMPPIY